MLKKQIMIATFLSFCVQLFASEGNPCFSKSAAITPTMVDENLFKVDVNTKDPTLEVRMNLVKTMTDNDFSENLFEILHQNNTIKCIHFMNVYSNLIDCIKNSCMKVINEYPNAVSMRFSPFSHQDPDGVAPLLDLSNYVATYVSKRRLNVSPEKILCELGGYIVSMGKL